MVGLGPAQARRLEFPLIGVEIRLPDVYQVEQAGPVRVVLTRPDSLLQVSLYRVEFGNFERLSAAQEQQLVSQLRLRLGSSVHIEMQACRLAGRSGRRFSLRGQRAGAPWASEAAMCLRGGQATILEVLYPAPSVAEGRSLFAQLLSGLSWTAPDKG